MDTSATSDKLPVDSVAGAGTGDIRFARGNKLYACSIAAAIRCTSTSVEAAPEGGVVRVRVEAYGDEQVRVLIENAGVGIPPEMRERIFHPFFTTKARGTGLGLPIARQIVEAHRGTLTMESNGVSETRFIVELPTTAPVLAAGARP